MKHPAPLPPLPRLLIVDLPLAAFITLGVAGTIWVSDDLDMLRFNLVGWIGMPLTILYFASLRLYPKWPLQMPRLARSMVVGLALTFAGGVLALVNAVTSDQQTVKRTVQAGLGIATSDVQRGGFGWVFKIRRF